MTKDDKAIKRLERDRWQDKEVDRRNAVRVIVQKGPPALRRWQPAAAHIPSNRRLSDLEAEYLVELIAGAAALGAVLLMGRWSPLAPFTAGALLIVVGVLSHASMDFFRKMVEWWPTDRGRFGWVDLLANGVWAAIGVVLVLGGVSHMIGRRQM